MRGLVDVPSVDAGIRAALSMRWDHEGAAPLHAYLGRVDPRSAQRIHPNDKLRVVRALEVYEQTGEAMGTLREQHALGAPRYRSLTYRLHVPPVHLQERQRQRIAEMLDGGWVDETQTLLRQYGPEIRALSAVGYRQLVQHITDGTSLDDTRTEIERATKIYARRQNTWFKSDRDVTHTLTPDALRTDDVLRAIETHLRADDLRDGRA
jgi:tRNA dimethylallyltransferase